MTREHMLDDQRFAWSRPDVLVYQTDVLEEDVTIAGPITAHLQVSTTGTDSDWVVKLIDVFRRQRNGSIARRRPVRRFVCKSWRRRSEVNSNNLL